MGDVATIAVDSLPALVDRASQVLAAAKSSAEILEARDMAGAVYDAAKRAARLAKAKDAHDELVSAAHRAQADALVIEAQAKIRLANEYELAQERGEVQKHGKVEVPGENLKPATLADIGLTKKIVHEARKLRDAEAAQPGIVRRTLDEKLQRGEEPTKAAVNQAVAEATKPEETKVSAEVVTFKPKEPFLPSFEAAEADDEEKILGPEIGAKVDADSAEGRSLSVLGAIQIMDFVKVTGTEFWATFDTNPSRKVYEGWVRKAHAQLSDILKEIGNVQLRSKKSAGLMPTELFSSQAWTLSTPLGGAGSSRLPYCFRWPSSGVASSAIFLLRLF